MKKYISCLIIILLLIAYQNFAQQNQSKSQDTNLKSWTIANGIKMRSIQKAGLGDVVFPSPDNKYFYVSTYRGNLKEDTKDYTIHIYSFKDVIEGLNNRKGSGQSLVKPFRSVKVSGNYMNLFLMDKYNSSGWTSDSKSIIIQSADALDGNEKQLSRLYKYNINDGSLVLLNKMPLSIGRIKECNGFSSDGSVIAYSTELMRGSFTLPKQNFTDHYPYAVVNEVENSITTSRSNYLYKYGKITELKNYERLWLSLDGKRLIAIESNNKVSNVPAGFRIIDTDNLSVSISVKNASGNNYVQGNNRFSALANIIWTPDNKYAIIVNASLNTKPSVTESYIVAVNLSTGIADQIASMTENVGTIKEVFWSNEKKRLVIGYNDTSGKKLSYMGYTVVGNGWNKENLEASLVIKEREEKRKLPGGMEIKIKEDINTPPMLVATKEGEEVNLLEPDEELKDVYIAHSQEIIWKVPDGTEYKGGLTLPMGYKEGLNPLPLVIAFYMYRPERFEGDAVTNGFAYQTLAANGYAVLNFDLAPEDRSGEGPNFVEKMDAAIDELVKRGIVDPKKIGIIGFSRSGYEAFFATTHPAKYKLAAAEFTDAFLGAFDYYLFTSAFGAYNQNNHDYHDLYKGSFWENKESWLKLEPIFNIDKVTTPIHYSFHGYNANEEELRSLMPFFYGLRGAFKLNNKPMELTVYSRSMHGITYPQEQKAAIEVNLDWMNFWLKGIEDPNPEKAEQYIRWREFRKMQAKNISLP